jgi:hypothetical protein
VRIPSAVVAVCLLLSSAVVVGAAVVEFAPEAMAQYSGRYRYIRVYANEQSGWKAISLQLSRIEPNVRP